MRSKAAVWIFCIITLSPVYAAAQQNSNSATITILQVNDVYEISPVDNKRRGGLARVAALVKQQRARNPRSIFLMAGDFLSPSLASKEFKGEQMVDALNAAGLDIAALGNHEFDVDLATLGKRISESRFPYIAANVFDKQKPTQPLAGVKPYVIKDFDGLRVAIFGLLTTETAAKSNYGSSITVTDPIPAGVSLAQQLRRQGAHIVIALTHLSMCEDKELARRADIDLIIGGHEHELLQATSGGKHISKMGSDARNLGRMDLHLTRDPRSRRFVISAIDWLSIPVDESVTDDTQTAQVVAKWEAQLSEKYPGLSEEIGNTTVKLDALSGDVRRHETNLGNLIADVYRQAFAGPADTAIVNSGGIRSDKTYGPGALTRRDLFNILPYSNTLVKARVTGEQLKRALENGVSLAGAEDGRFPQVSGLSFSYDASKPVGSRVIAIEIGGVAYDPQKSYTIVVNSYAFGGGDGYDFKSAQRLSDTSQEPSDRDTLIKYIQTQKTIAPVVEGRIKSAQSDQAPLLDSCAPAVESKPRTTIKRRAGRRAA